jgi:hypothetical protein
MLKKSSRFVLWRHSRLTISAAFTNVPRFIQRGVNLRGSTYGLSKHLFPQAMGGLGENRLRFARKTLGARRLAPVR